MKKLLFLFTATLVSVAGFSQTNNTSKDDLYKSFVAPPNAAQPRVWWHWMNGNVSKEGIKADLEWMNRSGIGGFQNFDAGLSTLQVVEKRLVYMTPEWKDAFSFTTRLADSLGLEMAIAGSPGWSESGGPWVKPEEAMKKFVWSETQIEGGKPFLGALPKPPSVSGAFQNLIIEAGFGGQRPPVPNYYADAAVVAYQLPTEDLSMQQLNPKVTSSDGNIPLQKLIDGDIDESTFLPAAEVGENSWIQYEFNKPTTIKAFTMVVKGGGGGFGPPTETRTLEGSDDGVTFNKIMDIPGSSLPQTTLVIKPTTAKYFRFAFAKLPPPTGPNPFAALGFGGGPQGPQGANIAELVLHPVARVNRFEDKAAFTGASDLYTAFTPEVSKGDVVNIESVIDLTTKMTPDGKLTWTPPPGNWMILRLGYSLTGHQNGPASPEATGLEVDKLSAKHVASYFNNYLDQYKDATNGLMGKRGLQFIITDSWEAGVQNWTDDMLSEFKTRRGYSMIPWLPVLSGHIVKSAAESDKFLWDFRKTLADLVTENHYDQLTKILKERGMGRYSESHEARRAFIGDGMEAKKNAEVPMGAGWTPGGYGGNEGDFATVYQADIRESASVSHLYGQKYVAAESLTAMFTDWAWSPELLKPIADYLMACGLNRFVIHTSVHQPLLDKKPGLSLGPFGQWFTRNETWADQSIAWTTYLSRSSYLLQQGKFVADIGYYYGEDNNITTLFRRQGNSKGLPSIPEGYNYDFINADALVNLLGVENGQYTTPTGMSYRLLVLDPNSQYMTLTVLKRIKAMVNQGASVSGPKPIMTPSLSDDPNEFNTIVAELWPSDQGTTLIGKGKVYTGQAMLDVLKSMDINPDFQYNKPKEDTKLFYLHRKVEDTDIYWVNNRKDREEDVEAIFRVEGKAPEIWHPETGQIENASYKMEGGLTKVQLHLETNDAVFVVFRRKTSEQNYTVVKPVEKVLLTLEGPWPVSFQKGRGAPDQTTLDSLKAWNENKEEGIKYFSGTGTYSKTINVTQEWLSEGTQIFLDMGKVKDLVEVVVNGQSAGIVWKTPFKINITDQLHQGENTVEIKVTNLWKNRLIGDRQPGATEYTFTTTKPYTAETPLMESGLLGPVKLVSVSAN